MNRLVIAATAWILGTGCVSARVREAAEQTLDCGGQIQLEQSREHRGWSAVGCGRQAYCVVPQEHDAEVVCAGGGPARPHDQT